MFFTLVYAYLSIVPQWKAKRRRMKFLRLIGNLSRHSSISVMGRLAGDSGRAGGMVFQGIPSGEAVQLVQESQGKILVSKKIVLDLRGWTLYMGVSPEETSTAGQQFVLFEAVVNPDSQTLKSTSVKVTDYGTPLAWNPGPPFKFLIRCNMDSLVTLVLGMIDRQLTAEDNLDIQSMTTVQVQGHADRLIQTHSTASLWRSTQSQPICTEQTDVNSMGSSNESLASVGKDSVELQQHLSRLSPSVDIDDEEIANILSSDGPDGEFAAGEAMADFSEETTVGNGHHNNIPTDNTKPPNVLIYCGKKDSSRKFKGVFDILSHCLNQERYVIYHLKHEQVHTTPWTDSCSLLVLSSEKLYDEVDQAVYDYFQHGGKVLSFCSSLDHFILKREILQDSAMNIMKVNCGQRKNVFLISSRHCYADVNSGLLGRENVGEVQVLGTAGENDNKPVIVKVRSTPTEQGETGVVILSQVYLDKDPGEMGISSKIFKLLKESNPAKFDILCDLLGHLGLDCSQTMATKLTPATLLAKDQTKLTSALESLSGRMKDGIIRTPKKTLVFVTGDSVTSEAVTEDSLPVLTGQGDAPLQLKYFKSDVFFKNLNTKCLGQVILYADVVPTTMTLLDGIMFSIHKDIGVVAIAGRQTNGRGRGGNSWISPEGCGMFSAHVRVDLDSQLGQKAAFLQHIAAVAVVHSIRNQPGYESLDLRVKWPNDIYYGKSVKLGGVIVTSSVMNGVMHANVGCGVNVSNQNPTVCINDLIHQHNVEMGSTLEPFSTEELLGRVLTMMEQLITEFQQHGPKLFCKLYYRYWLHSGTSVRLENEGGQEVTIQGLDDNGYLEVLTPEGRRHSLQPDGNSFDMLRNLITIKDR